MKKTLFVFMGLALAFSLAGCEGNVPTSAVKSADVKGAVSAVSGGMQEFSVKKVGGYGVRTLFNKKVGYYFDVPSAYGSIQVMGGNFSSTIYDDSEYIGPLLPNGSLLSDDEKHKFFVYLNEQPDALFSGMKVDKSNISSDGKVIQYDAYNGANYYFSCRVFSYVKPYTFCFNKENDVVLAIVDSVRLAL